MDEELKEALAGLEKQAPGANSRHGDETALGVLQLGPAGGVAHLLILS
jgi:hypothetical protein